MKQSDWPLVSICIPTYNGERYLSQALESAFSQTYPNLEIVVSDDASTDQTLTIVKTFQEKSPFPFRIVHHPPKGIGANWNHCIQQTNGDYIKFLFQDDVLQPDCITAMMRLALTDSQIGLVYCKRSFLYEEETEHILKFIDYYGNLHTYWDQIQVNEGVLSGKRYLKDKQLLNSPKNKIGEPTAVLLKRECFDTIGFFNETLQQSLDHEYWYRAMTKYKVGFIDKPLVKFRLHADQASVKNKRRPKETMALYHTYYKTIYNYLHPANKRKLRHLFHPILKQLVALKRRMYD